MMKVTYYHTLYKRETSNHTDKIRSDKDAIYFASGGHVYRIEHEYVRSIDMEEDELAGDGTPLAEVGKEIYEQAQNRDLDAWRPVEVLV